MLTTGETDHIRRVALRLATFLLFLRITYLHQIQTDLMGHLNLRLLYVFGTPALLGILMAGGLQRAFRGWPAYYWVAYAGWITLSVPFSSWKGGSLRLLVYFVRSELLMLFAIAGLAVTWRECKSIMYVISSAAVVNLVSARLFAAESTQQRLSLELSSIGNANDFAAHLLLVLPFLLWTALNSRSGFLRLGAMLGVVCGLYLILRTGSRGAVVGLGLDVLVFLIWGTTRQRLALFTLGPITVAAILAIAPSQALRRSVSFSGGSDAVASEAEESSESRRYLLRKSVEYAVHHPVFGVGLGMFANYEGVESVSTGHYGSWHVTHNSFTQAASECGIPAMLLFMAGIASTLILVNATWRDARRRHCEEIQTTAFCMMLSIVGFSTAMAFLSLAYTFYLPAMGGLAISIACAAKEEFAVRDWKRMLLNRAAGAAAGALPTPMSAKGKYVFDRCAEPLS